MDHRLRGHVHRGPMRKDLAENTAQNSAALSRITLLLTSFVAQNLHERAQQSALRKMRYLIAMTLLLEIGPRFDPDLLRH